tara:strand:- start:81 stop:1091 length:1011 start_codon:yes stop_codon:yes gene_type:complete
MPKTKLVTAFFSFLEGYPYYGQNTTRVERYLHSLASIAKTGEEIVCYLEEKHLEMYKDFWNSYGKEKGRYDINNFTNITFKYTTLEEFKHTPRMKELKTKYPNDDNMIMFHEIDWYKLQLLEQEIDNTHDYFYWIDCGLSHAGLFPPSASENPDQPFLGDFKHYSSNYAMYDFGRIFNPNLFPKINNFVNEKLLGICTEICFWDIKSTEKLINEGKYFQDVKKPLKGFSEQHNIGGIIGGHKTHLNTFLTHFNKLSQICLNNELIPNHEVIMHSIMWHYPEFFEQYKFKTWYHEKTYMTMGALMDDPLWQANSLKIKKEAEEEVQFYGFFSKIGLV